MRWKVLAAAVTAMALGAAACAAHTVRDQVRVSSHAATDATLDIDQAEFDLFNAKIPGYGQAEHDHATDAMRNVILAVRGYERLARNWPQSGPVPAELDQAAKAVTAALDDYVKVFPAIEAIRAPIGKAVAALRAIIASGLVSAPARSEMPLPVPIEMAFAVLTLLGKMIKDGRTSLPRLLGFLKQEGATDEELDADDVRLTAALARRDAEIAGRGPAGG